MIEDTGRYAYQSFDAMGTRVNFWIDRAAGHRAEIAFNAATKLIHDFDRRLSRFNPESELCMLNEDPRTTVPVSSLMARFVDTAVEVAQLSDGLLDPTLIEDVEDLGYRESLAGVKGASLEEALASAPAPTPATPDSAARWREVSADVVHRMATRTPGVRLDTGGCGKGLAADMVASIWSTLLDAGTGFIVDCGGDMRVGDLGESDRLYEIQVDASPSSVERLSLTTSSGGIATSGIGKRIWRNGDDFAHHLIDPGTGLPAWTGVASATALGPTALIAESIAKVALLSGPDGAREVLARHGGVFVEFDGNVTELVPSRTEVVA